MHEIISVNSPFCCPKDLEEEEENVLNNLFSDSFFLFIIHGLADGFPAISLREIVFKKKKPLVASNFLR